MKQIIALALALLLLAGLSACDLRNRQSSEDFIPSGTADNTPRWTGSGSSPDPVVPQERSVIKTVLSYDGEIRSIDPPRSCSYRLPMIDLGGAEAMACNQEIEERFGALARQSMEAIENWQDPILLRLDYSSFTQDGILTLRIDRQDLDGAVQQAWYAVDAASGDAVPVQRLFAAAGVKGEPQKTVEEVAEAAFRARFGAPASPDAAWTTALTKTQEALLPLTANRMHLTEDGGLIVAVELFAPDGGSSVEALRLP